MATQIQERSYRAAEKKFHKEQSRRAVQGALATAKRELIRIESKAAGLGVKKLDRLCRIIGQIESLQCYIK